MKRRDYGDGSIFFETSRDRWVGTIDLGRDADGKRQRRKVTGSTRSEVRKRLDDLRRQADAGLPVTDGSMTFGELLDEWLAKGPAAQAKSSNTTDSYRWAVEHHLRPALGHIRLRQLRPEDVERLLKQRADEGMAKATVARIRAHAARALRWAQRRDFVARNSAELAELPATARPPEEGRSLTPAQAKALLEAAALTSDQAEAKAKSLLETDPEQARAILAAKSAYRYGPLVTVGLMLGLRPGELCGLRWCDLEGIGRGDECAPILHVRQTLKREYDRSSGKPHEVLRFGDAKTSKSHRTVGIPAPAVEALRRQRAQQKIERMATPRWTDLDLVFATEVGTPINPSNLRRAIASLTKAAGLGEWHPNELRHSAASLLSAAGVPQHEVADLLGHVDGRMLDRHYRHRVEDAVTAGVAPMEALFGA